MNGLLLMLVVSFIRVTLQIEFTRNDTMSGRVPTDVRPITARSTADCGCICTSNSLCRGFYHSIAGQYCYLDINENITNFNADNNAVYFKKNDGLQTSSTEEQSVQISDTTTCSSTVSSPTPTTTVSTTTCPSTSPMDIYLVGNSGNNYTYKMFDTKHAHEDARLKCIEEGMHLFRPTDENKIADLALYLPTCDGYNINGIWVETKKETTTNGQVWLNSDGSTIPNEVWCSNSAPGASQNQLCARLASGCAFKLKDKGCTHQYFVICE